MAQVLTEAFVRDIEENLYADNEFVTLAVNDDVYVSDKTVHVPQAGSVPTVVKNRAVLPAAVGQRTDAEVTYDLDEYTTDPIYIPNIETLQLSYSKRTSVLFNHQAELNNQIGLNFLNNAGGAGVWAGSGTNQIVLTTGTATSGIAPPTSTLTPKSIALADIGNAAAKLDYDNMPKTDRYMVIQSTVYWDMLRENPTILNKDYNPMSDADVAMGVVKILYGFKIITRHYTAVYTNGTTPTKNAVGATATVNDLWACIAWQIRALRKAKGAVNFFANEKDAVYYGDIYSALVMFASKISRTNGEGIVTIVQDT